MKRAIPFLVLGSVLLLLGSSILIAYTLGWIAPINTITTNHVAVGELRYTLSGSFITPSSIVAPGDELIDVGFSVDNASPISSRIRVQITYTTWDNVGGVPTSATATYAGGSSEALAVTFASGFVYSDGYWYITDTSHELAANSGTQDLVSSIYYDGDNTDIDYAGQDVTVTLIIQVSQADNVTWTDLASYDFSTGYPA